ncbi:hypothetical protein ACFVWF_28495 [Rhodococcus qingshengii]|uniref:hypothetical protein n=1 Tax=Rhodococcus qingshengii TaxID=334542 RepID=UPI0036DD6D0B
MRKSLINSPVRRRVAVAATGIAAVAAIAVPGVAWASGGLSESSPVEVSAVESVPAVPSDISNGECIPALPQEEFDALVAKGEITLTDSIPADTTEPTTDASTAETGVESTPVENSDAQVPESTPAMQTC